MLKKIRLIFAAVFFILITLLFLDFTGTLHAWFGWMAKIQFLPAVLALNFTVVAVLVLLTLLFGRIYCSVICPLGVFQDIISWFRGKLKKKDRMRFSYKPSNNILRYGVLAIFIVSMVAGTGAIANILAPYGAYGRIASNLFAPLYKWGNNLFAYIAGRLDSYAFYGTDVWIGSIATFVVAVLTFAVIVFLAWKGGRTYCNSVCPVGAVLGFLSKFSLFRIRIDEDKCTGCSLCARGCKASCIDFEKHSVDYSKCVDCFDCIGNCSSGAISFSPVLPLRQGNSRRDEENTAPADGSRRAFLSIAALVVGGTVLSAQERRGDGGLAVIEDKKVPKRFTPLVPAGSVGLSHFTDHCVACQLCVSVCENQVLRPSSDLSRLMMPEMSFERGYCRPECTKCGEVCPAGAIAPITVEEKSSKQIGHAVWLADNCLPYRGEAECGNCARHCPSGAIMMVSSVVGNDNSLRIPVINTEKCIGCGACEYLCPARPLSAIYVEGHEVHRTI